MKHLLSINFYGISIRIIKVDDEHYWVPVKQICDDIGIDFKKQKRQ